MNRMKFAKVIGCSPFPNLLAGILYFASGTMILESKSFPAFGSSRPVPLVAVCGALSLLIHVINASLVAVAGSGP